MQATPTAERTMVWLVLINDGVSVRNDLLGWVSRLAEHDIHTPIEDSGWKYYRKRETCMYPHWKGKYAMEHP